MFKSSAIHSSDIKYTIEASYSDNDGFYYPELIKRDSIMIETNRCSDVRTIYLRIFSYLKTYVRN